MKFMFHPHHVSLGLTKPNINMQHKMKVMTDVRIDLKM